MKQYLQAAGELLLALLPAMVLVWKVANSIHSTPLVEFFLQVAVLAAPLGVLAWFHGIYCQRLALWAALPCALSLVLLVNVGWLPAVWAVDLALVVVALGDLLTLPRLSSLSVERAVGRIASLRKPHPVTITVRNRSRRTFFATIREGVPAGLTARPAELHHLLILRSQVVFEMQLVADRRGAFELHEVFIRVQSRWGLWKGILSYPQPAIVHVYPDLKQLSQYAVLARANRLNLLGLRRTRRVGQDNEFERLRDYTEGDNYKHIDWRTTARRRKLTVKDFQQNQSQRLYFLIDCGRMMTNTVGGLSLLDHALNSALLLSYVALSHGDAVGFICFSDAIHSYVPARSGMDQMNRLLHASFNLFPRLVESRYDQAFLYLESQTRKRSLVILITNLIDDVNRNQVQRYLEHLGGRHLPMGVLLRDHRIFEFVDAQHRAGDGLFQAAAAADILAWRQRMLNDLHQHGVLSLDVFPEDLTAPLVNRYLDIKARHLL